MTAPDRPDRPAAHSPAGPAEANPGIGREARPSLAGAGVDGTTGTAVVVAVPPSAGTLPLGWTAAPGEGANRRPLRLLALLGMLSAAAAALQILEAPLPRLVPWLKPGLANALVLFAIVRISPWFAAGIVVFRSLLAGLALGLLFSPAHLLGLAGGLAAAATMTLAVRLGHGWLGLAGISILGAVAHNLAQLGTVGLWAGQALPLWFHLVVMVWLSIPSGLLVAGIAFELFRRTTA
ncbi:MAG: Gx transporter family protein [Candidatus Riflebacteria bacterium]|nr:Gx transporter family protein [Candidatus Riflebacteria bacterium]